MIPWASGGAVVDTTPLAVQAQQRRPAQRVHRQIDAGMVSEIWNGIVPQLRQLGLLAGAGAPRLTLVFDREGWSPRLFRELRALGIAGVTWIKGSQAQRWPDSDFREAVIPVRAPGGSARLEGQLAERPYDLGAGCQAREIRFWIDRRVRGAALDEETSRVRANLETAREDAARAAAQSESERQLAAELREQLAATRQSLCADLAERVEALERTRDVRSASSP